MEKRLKIFETNVFDGSMSFKDYVKDEISDEFDSKNFSEKEAELRALKAKFLALRVKAGHRYGFDGRKIIVPFDSDCLEGSYFEADSSIYDKSDDLYNVKIPGDIIILTKDNPGIVMGYPVSDDPVIIAEDVKQGISALCHVNIDRISSEIPCQMLDLLVNEYNSNIEDLKFYISSNLKKKHNNLIFKPKYIKNNPNIWKGKIKKKNLELSGIKDLICKISNLFIYEVNQERAIVDMLVKKGVSPSNITVSESDTFANDILYSTTFANLVNEDKVRGKFLVGAYYEGTFDRTCDEGRTRVLK